MILFIDTSDFNKMTFTLSGDKVVRRPYKIDPHKSHETLGKLESFLKANKLKDPKKQIKKIVFYKGKGSFTGLRVGAAIALALSLAWGASLVALKKD